MCGKDKWYCVSVAKRRLIIGCVAGWLGACLLAQAIGETWVVGKTTKSQSKQKERMSGKPVGRFYKN